MMGRGEGGLKCVMLSYRVSLAAVESRDEIWCGFLIGSYLRIGDSIGLESVVLCNIVSNVRS